MLRLALAAARATAFASRATGRGGGTTLPGRVLTALAPDAPRRLAQRLPRGCVVVSATNGKTTTCGLLAEVLRGRVHLARNSAGANLASGIASALAVRDAASAELGLFECDEAALLPRLQPRRHDRIGGFSRSARPLRGARARGCAGEAGRGAPRRRGRGRRPADRLDRRGASGGHPLRNRRSPVALPTAPRRPRAHLCRRMPTTTARSSDTSATPAPAATPLAARRGRPRVSCWLDGTFLRPLPGDEHVHRQPPCRAPQRRTHCRRLWPSWASL